MQYKLGVIGDPIEHSLSPKIHNIFSKQTNINIDYQAYHVPEDNLDSFIKDFFSNGGDGLNITLPHKINCLRFANNKSSLVNLIGAANTLHSNGSGEIFAESTDGVGLVNDLKDKCVISSANILI
jgi:Shikimate 5-dehydrogenase